MLRKTDAAPSLIPTYASSKPKVVVNSLGSEQLRTRTPHSFLNQRDLKPYKCESDRFPDQPIGQ